MYLSLVIGHSTARRMSRHPPCTEGNSTLFSANYDKCNCLPRTIKKIILNKNFRNSFHSRSYTLYGRGGEVTKFYYVSNFAMHVARALHVHRLFRVYPSLHHITVDATSAVCPHTAARTQSTWRYVSMYETLHQSSRPQNNCTILRNQTKLHQFLANRATINSYKIDCDIETCSAASYTRNYRITCICNISHWCTQRRREVCAVFIRGYPTGKNYYRELAKRHTRRE